MSNVYTGFEIAVENIDAPAVRWFNTACEYVDAFNAPGGKPDRQGLSPYEVRRLNAYAKEHWGLCEVEVSLARSLPSVPERGSVILWSDDGGNPDFAALLLQLHLKRTKSNGFFAFEVGFYGKSYGGAAYLVTAKRVSVFSTDLWLERQKAKYTKAAL